VYADPSRLQANEAGSFALKEKVAASPSGNCWERVVLGGVLSCGVTDLVGLPDPDALPAADDGDFEGTAAEVLGEPVA
jgi:hypothetical protein